MANSASIRDFLSRGTLSVMQCLIYFLLYPVPVQAFNMFRYWKSEGFFCGVEDYKELVRVCVSLTADLRSRGLLEGSQRPTATIKHGIRNKVVPTLKRESLPPPPTPSSSPSSWIKRILLKYGLELEKSPTVDEWEQGDVERISLMKNKIHTWRRYISSSKVPMPINLVSFFQPLDKNI